MELPFLPFDEPNSCNDCIFMDPKYNGQLCFLNQVDLNIDLLDNVLLKKVVVQPTKKARSAGPHKLKSKTTTNKQKSRNKNKKSRSVSTQLRGGSTEPNSDETNILRHHLFYTNENLKNYPSIHRCRYIYPNCYLGTHKESLTHHQQQTPF